MLSCIGVTVDYELGRQRVLVINDMVLIKGKVSFKDIQGLCGRLQGLSIVSSNHVSIFGELLLVTGQPNQQGKQC